MGMSDKTAYTLAEQVAKMIATYLQSAPFDKTKQGIITESLGDRKYSVKIDGSVFTVPSCTSDTYSVSDKVLVTFVQNDPKRKYIIGKA